MSMDFDFSGALKDFEQNTFNPDAFMETYEPEIRHALSAMAAVQSGEWKIVPVEPTEAMLHEGFQHCHLERQVMRDIRVVRLTSAHHFYQAMLNASPEFTQEKNDE